MDCDTLPESRNKHNYHTILNILKQRLIYFNQT